MTAAGRPVRRAADHRRTGDEAAMKLVGGVLVDCQRMRNVATDVRTAEVTGRGGRARAGARVGRSAGRHARHRPDLPCPGSRGGAHPVACCGAGRGLRCHVSHGAGGWSADLHRGGRGRPACAGLQQPAPVAEGVGAADDGGQCAVDDDASAWPDGVDLVLDAGLPTAYEVPEQVLGMVALDAAGVPTAAGLAPSPGAIARVPVPEAVQVVGVTREVAGSLPEVRALYRGGRER